MDRLITVKAMRERYGCSNPTAIKYLRQCDPHMEKPLVAPEWAVLEWEASRMVSSKAVAVEINHMATNGRTIVPRKR